MGDWMHRHQELLQRWSEREIHHNKQFIGDGPIDPERWDRVDKKVLFVAKEAYDESGSEESFSLSDLVMKEWGDIKYHFWWRIGYWSLAVRETSLDNLAPHPDYLGTYDATREAAKGAAVINIKKSGGVNGSNDDDLKRYIESDGDLLFEQIELLAPDIVIFCHTWGLLKHLWPDASHISELIHREGKDGPVLIDYWHPSNQYPNTVMFHALAALYQKYLKTISP